MHHNLVSEAFLGSSVGLLAPPFFHTARDQILGPDKSWEWGYGILVSNNLVDVLRGGSLLTLAENTNFNCGLTLSPTSDLCHHNMSLIISVFFILASLLHHILFIHLSCVTIYSCMSVLLVNTADDRWSTNWNILLSICYDKLNKLFKLPQPY